MKYLRILIILLFPAVALAHGGGLDKYGCHHDRQKGDYHCHRGILSGLHFSSQAEMLSRQGAANTKTPIQKNAVYHVGKVVSVADGDTITILENNKQIKVRLAEIDAPEKGQDYGMKAKQFLGNLVFGKQVSVKEIDWDKYGRMVGRVYLGDVDVNGEIVRNGYAWAYRQYLTDTSILVLESEAKNNKRGLWASDVHMPPWEWRHRK